MDHCVTGSQISSRSIFFFIIEGFGEGGVFFMITVELVEADDVPLIELDRLPANKYERTCFYGEVGVEFFDNSCVDLLRMKAK
ncbi:hypothetical protein V6N13_130704 [Hibiscus sabdariffa]